jgi:hypothetical protein
MEQHEGDASRRQLKRIHGIGGVIRLLRAEIGDQIIARMDAESA